MAIKSSENLEHKGIGARLKRLGDQRFVTGHGRYLADIDLPGTLSAAFLRSTHAHARIKRIDTSAALQYPGVRAVLTGEDVRAMLRKPIWGGIKIPQMKFAKQYPLAYEKVRFVGEPMVLVVAENRYIAEDACEKIEVEYEPLPAVVSFEQALAPDAPILYEELGDNVVCTLSNSFGNVDQLFADSPIIIRETFTTNRHTGVPIEPRGCIASYNTGSETMEIWISMQDPHQARTELCDLIGFPPHKMRVIAPDVGGGFGIKMHLYICEIAVVLAAIKVGQPVKWIQDRREDLLSSIHARDARIEAEIAVSPEGRVLGMRTKLLSDGGAYSVLTRGNVLEASMFCRDLPGPYDIQSYSYDAKVLLTNKSPVSAYRGVALPMTNFVMEGFMDRIARQLSIDPMEVRRLNLIKREQFPYRTVTGRLLEPGSYLESLELALQRIDYTNFRERQRQLLEEGRYVGIGVATTNEATAVGTSHYGKHGMPASSQEGCRLRIDPGGRVTAFLGTTSQGQGLETSLAQLIAEQLGVDPSDVAVHMGDTDSAPYGGGAWGSRCAVTGGGAALLACETLRGKILQIASHRLQVSPGDLMLMDGQAVAKNIPGKSLSLAEIAHLAYFVAAELPEGLDPGLEVTRHYEPPEATFSNATHAVIVEVDITTGRIHFERYLIVEDCGTILNPMIVDGQIHGGVAQGIGGAIYEHLIYDEEGQLLTTTFMDYLVPSATEIPDFEIEHLCTPSPLTLGGIKGMGESGTSAAPAAIANAVSDALRPFGIQVNRFPLNPNFLFHELQSSRKKPE